MKAPDKIYLHEEDFARIYTQPSSIIDDDIEYIRKDVLIGFLEAVKAGKDDVMLSVNSLIDHLKYNVKWQKEE